MAVTFPIKKCCAILLILANQSWQRQLNPKTSESTEALILTPYLKNGNIEEAVAASEVFLDGFEDIISYSGYFTVNEKHNGNLFFWYFPAKNNPEKAPVVLYLEGGPGASSMIGLFDQSGPFLVNQNGKLQRRKTTWTTNFNVIYIDSPVGTGFSFTDPDGYATNETTIGEDLHTAMSQFYQLFPNLAKNQFFITGESYAGKYVPALAITIYQKNQKHGVKKINLKGIAIGNGLVDPVNQILFADYMYQLGFIDDNSRKLILESERKTVELIKQKRYTEATTELGSVISNYTAMTGLPEFNIYNYYALKDPNITAFEKYIQKNKVRKALHVGNKTYNDGSQVFNNLQEDFTMSMAPALSVLLSNYRVLLFNGQLDLSVPYPQTVNFLKKLKFSAAEEYKVAPRTIWRSNGVVAGYAKTAGNLTEVMVRNAGHLVSLDQPEWGLDLLTRFIRNKPYD